MYEFKADPFVFLRKFLISFFELLDICCNKEIWNRANIMLYEELIGSVLLVEDGDILIIVHHYPYSRGSKSILVLTYRHHLSPGHEQVDTVLLA